MKSKLHLVNLLILLGYSAVIQLLALANGRDGAMMMLIFMLFAVGVHVAALLLGALIVLLKGDGRDAGQWALSALLVAILGFGACWGGATLAEAINGSASLH